MPFYRVGLGGGGGRTATGTFNYDSTREVTINLGFKPKYIALCSSGQIVNVYNSDISTTRFLRGYGSSYPSWQNIGTTPYGIKSITNTGFSVVGTSGSSAQIYYFAIG